MSSLRSLLSVARDALTAHAAAVDVTGKNITNANVPGYVRRTAMLEARPLQGGVGGGVLFVGSARMIDRFAVQRVMSESGRHSAAVAQNEGLDGLSSVLGSGAGTVGERMGAFFSAATELATNAADPTARAAFLARAGEVASAFQTAANKLSSQRADLLGRAGDTASEINTALSKVASLNEKIAQAHALGDEAPDLRDARDLAIGEIAERIGVQTVEEPNGMVTLLSSGTSLVSGREASSLSIGVDAQGFATVSVTRSSGAKADITAGVTNGAIGGMLQARDKDIVALQGDLDQLAFDFAGAVNTTHAAGYGLDGATGRNLYAPSATVAGAAISMAIDPAVAGQPNRIAASSTASGLPANNDLALAIGALGSQPLAGGSPPALRFAELGSKLGLMQTTAQNVAAMRQGTLAMAETARQQASGVSIEEEMVNLTTFERAFQSSMKVLQTADELLEGLIRDL